MANDYIAVIVSVSVLGGVVIIALIVVCILRIVSRSPSKHRNGDTMALQEPQEPPSYVHYPAPEPYTPTHIPENPWRAGLHDNPVREMNHTHDNMDSALPPGANGVPRRPSLSAGQYRPPSVPYTPSQHSYAQDMPRGSSYAQDMFRRPSNAEGVSRTPSLTQSMPEKPFHIEFRKASAKDHEPRKAPRRASLKPVPEIPSGHQDKLWYFYLQEDPNYFTDEALKRNKKQPRVWRGEKRGKAPSSAAPSSLQSHNPDARARWM